MFINFITNKNTVIIVAGVIFLEDLLRLINTTDQLLLSFGGDGDLLYLCYATGELFANSQRHDGGSIEIDRKIVD